MGLKDPFIYLTQSMSLVTVFSHAMSLATQPRLDVRSDHELLRQIAQLIPYRVHSKTSFQLILSVLKEHLLFVKYKSLEISR